MGYLFDGDTKIITLTAGTTAIDVKDLYSRWKDWFQNDVGNKYDMAMFPVGGDPINEDQGIYITTYTFLTNGWRIRPQEATHTLTVGGGVIAVDTGEDPFIPTIGAYSVQVKYNQPIRTETVMIEGSGTGGLTDEEHTQLMEDVATEADVSKLLTVAKFLALKWGF